MSWVDIYLADTALLPCQRDILHPGCSCLPTLFHATWATLKQSIRIRRSVAMGNWDTFRVTVKFHKWLVQQKRNRVSALQLFSASASQNHKIKKGNCEATKTSNTLFCLQLRFLQLKDQGVKCWHAHLALWTAKCINTLSKDFMDRLSWRVFWRIHHQH